jgi:hypothetical protein
MSEEQANKTQGVVVQPLLQALGFNATTPCEVVYAPLEIGGIGFRHLFAEQGATKMRPLLQQIRLNSLVGQSLVIMMQWAQIEAGPPGSAVGRLGAQSKPECRPPAAMYHPGTIPWGFPQKRSSPTPTVPAQHPSLTTHKPTPLESHSPPNSSTWGLGCPSGCMATRRTLAIASNSSCRLTAAKKSNGKPPEGCPPVKDPSERITPLRQTFGH